MLSYSILTIFIVCGIYTQFRGKIKHKKLSHYFNDHTNFFAPMNCLFYMFSSIKSTPYIDVAHFPELKVIQDSWETIRDEARNLDKENRIIEASIDDDFAYHSFYKRGWKKFGLTWYGTTCNSAKRLCPSTISLIDSVSSIKGAMFTMLPPGKNLMTHRDPFAGSLRYQLGLDTPNSEDCHIFVDGEKYYWKDGEAVMFDETYLHHIENKTTKSRIVLMLDIRRPVNFFIVAWVNTVFCHVFMSATHSKNMEDDKVGAINRFLLMLYPARRLGKQIKSYNKHLYYIIQYSLYVLMGYLLLIE